MGTESAGAPPPAAPATPSRSRRRWLWPTVAGAAAVAVVVAALFATGAFSQAGPGSPTPLYATFFEARSAAGPAAGRAAGGPWTAVAAVGLRLALGVDLDSQNLTNASYANCTVTAVATAPTEVALPPTPFAQGPGTAGFWLILFSNAGGQALGVGVWGGNATLLFATSGAGCAAEVSKAQPFPSGSFDSPASVGASNASGGSTFLSAHPQSTQILVGVGGITEFVLTSEPFWAVEDTSCTGASQTNGSLFSAVVQGEGNPVVTNASTTTLACRSVGPTGISPPSPLGAGSLWSMVIGRAR
jgi:hypothetical protein